MFEGLTERRLTVAELHSYLSRLIATGEPGPKLEVDTGNGLWRVLLGTEAFRCPPGKPSPIMLIFGTEDGEAEERCWSDHPVLARRRLT